MPQDTLSFMQRVQEYGALGFAWMMLISFFAGTARYIVRLNGDRPTFWGWMSDTICSGFVGLVVAMTCKHYQLDFYITSAIVGICAHNGTRSLYLFGRILRKNGAIIGEMIDEGQDRDMKYARKKEDGK